MINAERVRDGAAAQIDYRLMIDSLTDIELVMIDQQGIIRSWNKGAETLRGLRAEEMIGRSATTLYLEEERDGDPILRELAAVEQTGRYQSEQWQVGRQGRRFLASISVHAIRDKAGAVDGYVRTVRDLTELRRGEEEARIVTAMLDAMTDFEVIRLDRDGTIRSFSKGGEKLKGYRADEVVGKNISIFYPEQDARSGQAERELNMAASSGRFEGEGWRVRKGGARFWANVIITPVNDRDGKPLGFVKVARDLTERLEREKLLQRQRDEILELSTPVIQIWDKVLALPIIGTLDSQRASRLTENLLQKISAEEAEFVILDISGVPTIDTQVAQHLLKTVMGARLMGAESIISGVRPETAQAMVHLGIEMGNLRSRATLRDALQLALRLRRDRGEAPESPSV
jgi:rsbT co-antagonist protein RsbR